MDGQLGGPGSPDISSRQGWRNTPNRPRHPAEAAGLRGASLAPSAPLGGLSGNPPWLWPANSRVTRPTRKPAPSKPYAGWSCRNPSRKAVGLTRPFEPRFGRGDGDGVESGVSGPREGDVSLWPFRDLFRQTSDPARLSRFGPERGQSVIPFGAGARLRRTPRPTVTGYQRPAPPSSALNCATQSGIGSSVTSKWIGAVPASTSRSHGKYPGFSIVMRCLPAGSLTPRAAT